MQRQGTTYALVTNTAAGYGKVLSRVLTTDFDAYQELEVSVVSLAPNTQLKLALQMETSPYAEYPLGGVIQSPGIYVRNIPASDTVNLSGTHTYSICLRLNNAGANSAVLDYVRLGVTSTPTVTPTPSPTPVPNTFRPAVNLFIPKQGPLKINYTVQDPTRFRVTVFNLAGQVVRSLVNQDVKGTITGELAWDGKNDNGASVASGVYLIRLETDVYRQNIRVAVVQ